MLPHMPKNGRWVEGVEWDTYDFSTARTKQSGQVHREKRVMYHLSVPQASSRTEVVEVVAHGGGGSHRPALRACRKAESCSIQNEEDGPD